MMPVKVKIMYQFKYKGRLVKNQLKILLTKLPLKTSA